MEIDITSFFENADPSEFSCSRAEAGENAGPWSWANAKREGAETPLLTTPEQIDALRDYVKDFGAWSEEEIAAWDGVECNALFIQLVSDTIREAGLDTDPDETDWEKYQRNSEAGHVGSNLFKTTDGRVYYSLAR